LLDTNFTYRVYPNRIYKNKNLGQVNIKYNYCTEYIFQIKEAQTKSLNIKQLKKTLLQIGDSLVLVKDQEILKIHIHTNKPGKILDKMKKYKIEIIKNQSTKNL
jgi:dihydroxyacetone kinase-like predicted kinase